MKEQRTAQEKRIGIDRTKDSTTKTEYDCQKRRQQKEKKQQQHDQWNKWLQKEKKTVMDATIYSRQKNELRLT